MCTDLVAPASHDKRYNEKEQEEAENEEANSETEFADSGLPLERYQSHVQGTRLMQKGDRYWTLYA